MTPLEEELAAAAEQRRKLLAAAGPHVPHDRQVVDEAMQHRATLPKIAHGDQRAFLANLDKIARGEAVVG